MNILKLFIASISAIFLILGIWVNNYHYNCIMMIFPIIFLVIISSSFIELKTQERTCFKNCYFISNSFFAKMLSSKFFIVIFYILASIIMTISALSGTIEYSNKIWIYLVLHIGLTTILYKYLFVIFGKTLKDNYRALFAREWTINITALIMIISYIYFTINDYEPSYLRDSLEETWRLASSSINSNCTIINYFLKLQKEVDSISWWFIDNGTENIQDRTYKISIWISFLFINSFAILGVNRFIAQVIYLIDKIFKKEDII